MSETGTTATTSAEEALRKAREIAARLSGQPPPSGALASSSAPSSSLGGASGGESADDPSAHAGGGSSKRKRWGIMPNEGSVASGSASTSPTSASLLAEQAALIAKRLKAAPPPGMAAATAPDLSVQKRVWVSLDNDRPLSHYVSYLSRHLPDIADKVHAHLRGATVPSAVSPSVTLVELSLQGRGASKEPPVPGMPEQPLHVLIRGTKESTPVAAVWVEQALLDAQEAPLEGDGDDEIDGTPTTDPKTATGSSAADLNQQLALVAPTTRRGTSSYRPASVAQLIGVHTAGPDPLAGGGPVVEEEMRVPHSVVGLIIGRGGENIASLQAKTGCKVQIQKESELVPGQTHRVITLMASNQDSLDACRAQIERLVEERLGPSAASSSGPAPSSSSSSNKVQEALAAGHAHLQVPVPEEDVGLIIGKQGMTIRSIQDQTGANIQVPPQSESSGGIRIVDVTHPTHAGAQAAKDHIEGLLRSKPRGANGGGGGAAGTPQTTIQVAIPDKDVGLCIGRQGCVIKHMQNVTHTRIQVPTHPLPGQSYRVATITGPAEGCQQAKLMIETIVAEQSSHSVLAGGPLGGATHQQYYGQQYGGGAATAAPPGQQAYSAEWAAYQAAQQQALQQQQQHSTASTPPVTAATTPAGASSVATPASDAYFEQFFRYAYYYGEPAARQHYGAWSPPVGTPNPYGVNPNGIQPAPAAAAPASTAAQATSAAPAAAAPAAAPPSSVATPAPASAPPSAPQARETSRRNVSNLPAWMTKG